MLPSIAELEFENEELAEEDVPTIGKSFLFDFKKGDFVLKDGKLVVLEGIEALKMWIIKVIRTEKFRFRIYENTEFENDDQYGVMLEDLIGSNFDRDFIEAEIEREVTEALLLHEYIVSVDEWQFERNSKKMTVSFAVTTYDETLNMEVDLDG